MAYDDKHRMLLQVFVRESVIEENEVKNLVFKLFNNDRVSEVISLINQQLQILNMAINQAQCEISGQTYWILVSTILNEVTRFQDEFSKSQLALLRHIISEIISSNDGCIQSTMCLNLCSSPDIKLSKSHAEEFLNDIVERKWLVYKMGCYYMGVRSITELMPYFRATYGSTLNTCCLCKQVIFFGEKCCHCDSIIHLYCLKKFTMVHKSPKCPSCNNIISTVNLSDLSDVSTRRDENMVEGM